MDKEFYVAVELYVSSKAAAALKKVRPSRSCDLGYRSSLISISLPLVLPPQPVFSRPLGRTQSDATSHPALLRGTARRPRRGSKVSVRRWKRVLRLQDAC